MSIPYFSAGDLELALSGWPDGRFVALCNALIWAYAARGVAPISARFTEQEKAPDLGVDAELWIEVTEKQPPAGPLLTPGWNVFQFKRRNALRGKDKLLPELKRELKGAAAAVSRKASRQPRSYTLFTNLKLAPTQQAALQKAVLAGFTVPMRVAITDAAGIAAMLNDLPHVRAAFFGAPRFETWQAAWERLCRVKLSGAHVELVGREKELARLQRLVDAPSIHVILVHGVHDVGKDRLILESTKHRQRDVLVSPDPEAPNRREMQEIGNASHEAIVIAEDLDWERVPDLVAQALAQEHLKLVCSIPRVANASLPNYGFDQRVQTFFLAPLSEPDSRELLKKAGADFDYMLASWVIEHAGGIPGVLLLAASLGSNLRERTEDFFFHAVGRAFQARVEQELGDAALDALKVLSVLTRVAEPEIDELARALGYDSNKIRGAIEKLQASGLLLKRGPFHEVNPPIFAQYLASQAVAGERLQLYRLVLSLESPARVRLFRRLAELPSSPQLQGFWNEVLGGDGLYKGSASFSAAGHLLPILAEPAPEATVACIQRILEPLSVEERKSIAGEGRASVIDALDLLLLRPPTAAGAAYLLLLLAEAENEAWADNATVLFFEFFLPLHLHPQVAAAFEERLEILRRALTGGTEAQQLLAVEAARKALTRYDAVRLRRSAAFIPPERPTATDGELYDYAVQLLNLLLDTGSRTTLGVKVLGAAREAVPEVALEVASVRPDAALAAFRQYLGWLQDERSGSDSAKLVNCLERAIEYWETKKETTGSHAQDGRRILSEIDGLSFFRQVQRWVGETTSERWEEVQKALRDLAKRVVKEPRLLSGDLLNWLLQATGGWLFFLFLGEEDASRGLLPMFETLAKDSGGAQAFRSYCSGWAKADRGGFRSYLQNIQQRAVCAEAMLYAANALPGEPRSLDLILTLLRERRVDSWQVEGILIGSSWIESLEPQHFREILQHLADPSLENALAATHLLWRWLNVRRTIEGELREFAWRCLEMSAGSRDEYGSRRMYWYRDQLAGYLTSAEPDRGFRLLERLAQESPSGWDPVAGLRRSSFWHALLSANRPRALRTVLGPNSNCLFLGCWEDEGVFDQLSEAGLLVEIALASAKSATLVVSALSFNRPGFWEIALPIAARYFDDEDVRAALDMTVFGAVVHGSTLAEEYERRRREVERVLQDLATPAAAMPWLRRLETALKREMSAEAIWEYDLDARDLKRFVEDRNAPERLWAIGRILKYAKWEDVQKLLTPQDINEALPLVDLPESQKKALETALEYWMHRV